MAAAFVAVAIVLVRYLEPEEKGAALSGQPAAREATAVAPDPRKAATGAINGNRPIAPSEPNDSVTNDADLSSIRAFLDLREIPHAELVREDLGEFGSEARDPSWSAQMEAQLQSELSQTSLTLTGSYIECKTSTCIAILVRPSGAYNQTDQVGLPNGGFTRAMSSIAQKLGLLDRQPRQILAHNGALIHWHRFFRRCSPDWRCSL